MGTTPTFLLPYPEPTDPVANGAADIRALAEKVESRLYSAIYYESDQVGTYIDMQSVYVLPDTSGVWPVPSICKLTVVVQTTGWGVGVVPGMDIYSDDIPSPFPPGYGYSYCQVIGQPFVAAQVGGAAAQPQKLPPGSGVQRIPAGGRGMNWTVRVGVHNASGAIMVNRGIHAVMERVQTT